MSINVIDGCGRIGYETKGEAQLRADTIRKTSHRWYSRAQVCLRCSNAFGGAVFHAVGENDYLRDQEYTGIVPIPLSRVYRSRRSLDRLTSDRGRAPRGRGFSLLPSL